MAQGRVQSCLVSSENGNKLTDFIKRSIHYGASGRLLTILEGPGCTQLPQNLLYSTAVMTCNVVYDIVGLALSNLCGSTYRVSDNGKQVTYILIRFVSKKKKKKKIKTLCIISVLRSAL